MLKKVYLLILAATVMGAAGCATEEKNRLKKDTPAKPAMINVVKIMIKPYSVRITPGHTSNFKVVGIDADGKKVILNAEWKISEGETATGSLNRTAGDNVTFTAGTPGRVTIVAGYDNHKAAAAVEVVKRQ